MYPITEIDVSSKSNYELLTAAILTCPLIAALADTYTTTIQIAEITQHLPLSYRQVDRAEISMTHRIFRFDLYHYSPKAKYLYLTLVFDLINTTLPLQVGFFCMY
ncbi:hypothetical protein BLNAU_19422 [Blattamonas nauphoetae]|uniref:Uncharacterized protein n=1 Tax=Blattamonas nauphoetae TaxID=2049346 RepID=A0ABQ9X5M3_9EUKA|nr:hypothetical protein BLNAU_19422 [Blattamonas nauphoetae]